MNMKSLVQYFRGIREIVDQRNLDGQNLTEVIEKARKLWTNSVLANPQVRPPIVGFIVKDESGSVLFDSMNQSART